MPLFWNFWGNNVTLSMPFTKIYDEYAIIATI